MKRGTQPSKDPDILASAVALRRTASRVQERGRRTNTPVYVLEHGRIVDLTAEWRQRQRAKKKASTSPRSSEG
jgi:hypothetical protein